MTLSKSISLKSALYAFSLLLFSSIGITVADQDRGCGCGGGARSSVTVLRSDADFNKRVTDNSGLSVVKFFSPTCGPCRKLKAVYAQLAKKYGKTVKFYEFDINRTKSVGESFAVQSVPQVLFFSGKDLRQTVVGLKSLAELEASLKEAFQL